MPVDPTVGAHPNPALPEFFDPDRLPMNTDHPYYLEDRDRLCKYARNKYKALYHKLYVMHTLSKLDAGRVSIEVMNLEADIKGKMYNFNQKYRELMFKMVASPEQIVHN